MDTSNSSAKVVVNLSHLNAMKISKSAQQNIVIDALFHLDDSIDQSAIRGAITELFGIDIPSDMLVEIINQLNSSGTIQYASDNKIHLNIAVKSDIEKQKLENSIL